MKKTIRSLLVSLPLLIAAAPSFAGYQMRIPMEVAAGGSMQNGSITFTNKAETPPETVEPTEPEVVDPSLPVLPDLYGKVDPACNPFIDGNASSIDLINRERDWGNGYSDNNYEDGKSYIPCKLKPSENSNVIARFMYAIPVSADQCTKEILDQYGPTKNVCVVQSRLINFPYVTTRLSGGEYTRKSNMVDIQGFDNGLAKKGYTLSDVGRVEFDGVSCDNLTYLVTDSIWKKTTSTVPNSGCTLPLTYEQIVEKGKKEFLVEIYKK
jgi:hypothetical protein